jgi:cell division septation protein DedD
MDRQLAERMVGAACLLAVLVLVVPSILDGNQEPASTPPEPELLDVPDQRTHTLILDNAARVPPVPQPRDMPGEAAGTLPDDEPPAESMPAPMEPQAATPMPTPTPEPARPAVVAPPATDQAVAAASAAPPVPAEARAVPDAGRWYVQLGVFSSRQNAEGLAKKLQASGFTATIRKIENGAMSRVLVGPRADRAAAAELSNQLKAAGYAGQVTKL